MAAIRVPAASLAKAEEGSYPDRLWCEIQAARDRGRRGGRVGISARWHVAGPIAVLSLLYVRCGTVAVAAFLP